MKEKLYQIDNILMRLEDYIHGKDGDDITTARRNLIELLRAIEKAEEQAKVSSQMLGTLAVTSDSKENKKESEVALPSDEELKEKINEYGKQVYKSTSSAQEEYTARMAFTACYYWIKHNIVTKNKLINITMGILEEFNKSTITITQPGNHDYTEAIKRTPKGFILIKMSRSLDFYHWSAEYMKIEEWKKKGGEYSTDGFNPNVD